MQQDQNTIITKVHALEILDSRGFPTVEVYCELVCGAKARASVPSGASTGTKEAHELRDNNSNYFSGKGVTKAVVNVNNIIAKQLVGKNANNQSDIDNLLIDLDGTSNKSNLGANAILAVSLAVIKAYAVSLNQELYQVIRSNLPNQSQASNYTMPIPILNVLNGGAHADNNVDVQEFMIAPIGFDNFNDALRAGTEIYHCLKKILKEKKLVTAVGDEGGFAPNLDSNEMALDLLTQAVNQSGYKLGEQIYFALDIAASELYQDNKYYLSSENKHYTSQEFVNLIATWCEKYPIISVEDPMDENDWQGFKLITEQLGNKVQIVGDDLFVTNQEILKQGIDQNIANSILIKLNQIGTVTETLQTINLAKQAGYNVIISHRSGETEDNYIADFAVATNAQLIKTGAPARSDRVAKYNQLLRINNANKFEYIGINGFNKFI